MRIGLRQFNPQKDDDFSLRRDQATINRASLAVESSASSGGLSRASRFAGGTALAGFILFSIFAPHSIAGAEISLGLAALGWLARTLLTKRIGLRRTSLDLPVWLFIAWTSLSALLSAEPRISLLKLQSVCVFLLFYLTQAVATRRTALLLVLLMIASGVAGTLWSVLDIARGRGVLIEEVTDESPFHASLVGPGDAVWRINGVRVNSAREIDAAIKSAPTGSRLSASIIQRGEHAEWEGFVLTDEIKQRPSPSGLKGTERTHRFRASGWTRHYETFAEILQMLAQLALGLALVHLKKRGRAWQSALIFAACALLAVGIALTAMRTVLVALVIGACVITWRAARGRVRVMVLVALIVLLAVGALAIRRTRISGALELQDASAILRLTVARVGFSRIMLHPLFGHGMDAMHRHWSEWGFPGTNMVHLHSTPLQIAFDRGLPALVFWLWIICVFWRITSRGERSLRDSTATGTHGILLGATGALAGFFASSLVNYNFGAGLTALVFWWLMGIVVKCVESPQPSVAGSRPMAASRIRASFNFLH